MLLYYSCRMLALSLVVLASGDLSSVCSRNCSGHGVCVEWHCRCEPGFYGEDCSDAFFLGSMLQPTLTAGSLNLTRDNFTTVVRTGARCCACC